MAWKARWSYSISQMSALDAKGDSAGYNALVPEYNATIAVYEDTYAAYLLEVDEYNKKVDEGNKISRTAGRRVYLLPIPVR